MGVEVESSYRVMLIHDTRIYILWDGVVLDATTPNIAGVILSNDSAYIAGVGLYVPLARLNNDLQNTIPGWRMRFSTKRRHAYTRDGKVIVGGRFFADYISISNKIGNGHSKQKRITKRFTIINLELFKNPPPEDPREQISMACALLDMCSQRGVKFRSTRGALASALLKKSPEWHKGRKAAPYFINTKTRDYLPGNFYSISHKIRKLQLRSEKDTPLNSVLKHCYYLDQDSAHHNIVSQYPLPHPEDIRARGNWKAALRGKNLRWCYSNSEIGRQLVEGRLQGLVLANVSVQHIAPTIQHFCPPFAQTTGLKYVWFWTPDFRIARLLPGISINSFVCALVGRKTDSALREYSQWSLSEIKRDKPNSSYKKSTLLAAYGMLAYKPDGKPIYRYWGGQDQPYKDRVTIPQAGLVREHKITFPDNVQPSIVNVIARGLIEAETRTRSIEYAYELHKQGYHIPQIYADGIIVETEQLGFLRDGWRIHDELTNVWIPRKNAFMSDTLVKLPGINQTNPEDQVWIERYEEAKRPFVPKELDRPVAV